MYLLIMVMGTSGWMMSSVLEMRADSSTVLPDLWDSTTVLMWKMLESDVKVDVFRPLVISCFHKIYFLAGIQYHVCTETLDFKEAQTLADVWRSATMVPGAQCVMTCGTLRMLELHVDSWDCPQQVSLYSITNCNMHMLNYYTLVATPITTGFTKGIFDIWLDDVQCAGTESQLIDCPARPLGSEDCYHFQDAGVSCPPVGMCSHS